MRGEIEAFVALAREAGLVTEHQDLLLHEICSEEISIEEFANVMTKAKLVPDEGDLRGYLAQASQDVADGKGPESIKGAVAAGWEVAADLDWFCHLAVKGGLLTEETCLGLVSSFEEASELISLAQFLVSSGICDDVDKIQDLVDAATTSSQGNARPPESIFRK